MMDMELRYQNARQKKVMYMGETTLKHIPNRNAIVRGKYQNAKYRNVFRSIFWNKTSIQVKGIY